MVTADSSEMNSADVMQQIREQTSDLVTGEVQEEETTTEFQAEQEVQGEEEQPEETTEEQVETTQEAEPQVQPETDRRIKVDGREIEIPPEKVKEYLQKGFKFEEKMRELKRHPWRTPVEDMAFPLTLTLVGKMGSPVTFTAAAAVFTVAPRPRGIRVFRKPKRR